MLIGVILTAKGKKKTCSYTIKFDRNYSFCFFNMLCHTYADQTSLLPTAHILLIFFFVVVFFNVVSHTYADQTSLLPTANFSLF